MSELLDATPPGTGELLDGRYRLLARIGEGGMGRVYRATDEMLHRDVAVKLLHPHKVEPAHDQRTASEARLLAAVDHASLVTLYDARIGGTGPSYLVMELIPGGTLRDRLQERILSPREAAYVLGDLAGALEVIHAAGVVHRDLKPSNVMLRPIRDRQRVLRATLADFGIAYLVDSTRVTTPGTVVGTAAYLAPEQVRGEPPRPASDVYALGLLLLEALTGERAFRGASMQEVLAARLTRRPDIPASVGRRWSVLLTSMTETDPAARPTAEALRAIATDLEQPLTAEVADAPTVAVEAEPTTPLSPQPTASTRAYAPDPIDDEPGPAYVEPDRERPWGSPRLMIAAAVIAVILIAAAVVWILMLTQTPTVTPNDPLPSVPQPLQDHLDQLLDRLTP